MRPSIHSGRVVALTTMVILALSSCDSGKRDRSSTARNDETDHGDDDAMSPPDTSDGGLGGAATEPPIDGGTNSSSSEPLGSIDAGNSTTGDTSAEGDPPNFHGEPALSYDDAPLFSGYVRLTHRQWENSVVDNLRLEQGTDYAAAFPADQPSRYSNNERVLTTSTPLVSAYQAAAEAIADTVVLDPDALARVSSSREPEAFITEVGRRFYRRPLSTEETSTYLTLFDTGVSLARDDEDTFAAGARLLLEAWMQAPNFLYRVEQSDGLLDGYEMATRLAYALTDSTPSDSLLQAAGDGELNTESGVHRAAQDLLESARAREVFRRFHHETFILDRLKSAWVSDTLGTDEDLRVQLEESAHLFFDRLFRERFGLRHLLLSDVAYVNHSLATLYAVEQTSSEFQPMAFGLDRTGVFAQLPFLMMHSSSEAPNAFQRGAMLTKWLLCQQHLEEPAGVDPAPTVNGKTNRERSSELVAAAECQECHRFIDPLGFAFENFDGLGRQRTQDNGYEVDTSGTYPFSVDADFTNSRELMQILAESPLAHGCYSKQLSEFTLSRALGTADEALVTMLRAMSLNEDAPLVDLVAALVSSERFRSFGGAL